MKVLVNISVELPDEEDSLEFFIELADSPLPRPEEEIHFDLAHGFVVDRVQHVFRAGGSADEGPEVWLYCVQGEVEARMGYTVDTYRKDLSEFAAVTWED
jgi:hypothetical protein